MSVSHMLDGKVVVVTGAGGGIGRDIALMAGANGARVVVNDIGAGLDGSGQDDGPAARVVAEIKAAGGEAVASLDSVADAKGAQRIVQTALDAFGRLDGVVNNAGILRDALFHKMTPEQWLSVIGVHLNGSFFVSRAAAELFRQQESGAFVHMTSASGLVGNVGQANYSAAKAAIVGLSKSIALDMQRFNVRSNCIAPFAWGRMTENIPATTPDQIARVERLRKMTPEKNAALAVYLASDAAKGVTGQIFSTRMNEIFLFSHTRPVRSVHRDGGWTAETVRDHAMPSLAASFVPLDRSQDVFSWDPI